MQWMWNGKGDSARHILLRLLLLRLVLCMLPIATAVGQRGSTAVIPKQSIAQVPSPLSLEVRPTFDLPLGEVLNGSATGDRSIWG